MNTPSYGWDSPTTGATDEADLWRRAKADWRLWVNLAVLVGLVIFGLWRDHAAGYF